MIELTGKDLKIRTAHERRNARSCIITLYWATFIVCCQL